MMSFKLALKSIQKNMKDFVIYFITLLLGVAIFYIFNSLESQQAMMKMADSQREIMKFAIEAMQVVSVFVSIVLGFLIVYANNFLIKRRKKEFGLYMTLGMSKGQISRIILIETVVVGILSLAIGLIAGVLASQGMSVLVARMFEADMDSYRFIFSSSALTKTLIYFAVIYCIVIVVNILKTSRYKLLDLLNASKKNEKVKIRNQIVSIILFIISVIILGSAYFIAIYGTDKGIFPMIIAAIVMGILGTFLFVYSLSGFVLKVIQGRKKYYNKDLNSFLFRQINSKINTTTVSMSVISLLLFLTICIFSSALNLNSSATRSLKEYTPVDITLDMSVADQPNENIIKELGKMGLDVEQEFSEYVRFGIYVNRDFTLVDAMGEKQINNLKEQYPHALTEMNDRLMKLSDYNKVQRLSGREEIKLENNQYAMLATFEQYEEFRKGALDDGKTITLYGKEYRPYSNQLLTGTVENMSGPYETGLFVLPDEAIKEEWKYHDMINANYKGTTKEEKQQVEERMQTFNTVDGAINYTKFTEKIDVGTKIQLYNASKGLGAAVTFIGLYLGITFLIASAAILALKELSDSSDNKERYDILRKIGTDEKMINKALYKQIGIFFIMPLLLACIHSVFGIKVAGMMLTGIGKQEIVGAIIGTAILIAAIYGVYYVITCIGSKNIIKEENR